MSQTPEQLAAAIKNYYLQSASAYANWGRDTMRDGIYALHCGYDVPGESIQHWESVRRLTLEVVALAGICDGDTVLDMGCGTGVTAFEINAQYPHAKVFGINLAEHQLRSAILHVRRTNLHDIHFSAQDYLSTAFFAEMFDQVIFFESIAHAISKREAILESARLLKPGGTLTVADIFLRRPPANVHEQTYIDDLCRGWFIPDMNTVEDFQTILHKNGLEIEEHRDISANVFPSTYRMRMNAEKRMRESGTVGVSETIYQSRKAVIASHAVIDMGLVSYNLTHARKL